MTDELIHVCASTLDAEMPRMPLGEVVDMQNGVSRVRVGLLADAGAAWRQDSTRRVATPPGNCLVYCGAWAYSHQRRRTP